MKPKYRCDDQGGPQPPKPWTADDKKPQEQEKPEDEQDESERS